MGFVVSAHKARKALTLSRTAAHPQASFFADPDCADVFGSASAPVSPNFLSLSAQSQTSLAHEASPDVPPSVEVQPISSHTWRSPLAS